MDNFLKWFCIFWGCVFFAGLAFIWWPVALIVVGMLVIFSVVYFGFKFINWIIEALAWIIARTIEAPFRFIHWLWINAR